ncbi:hypothetical protein FACS1894201_06480 [Bacteroidia bacterium]|nr:hypothetical protein FACS1894201_06480 [Bacteroidia bacterium]
MQIYKNNPNYKALRKINRATAPKFNDIIQFCFRLLRRKALNFDNPVQAERSAGYKASPPLQPRSGLQFYKEKNVIIKYIKNQQEHHKVEVFGNEIKRLFKENGIDEDEKWFWQDE